MWDVYLYALSGHLMICDGAGGPSRESGWEADMNRKSTSHVGDSSMQMLCGTAQPASRTSCPPPPSQR